MVSFELKRLLQMPVVRQAISPSHFTKFQHYFKQSIAVLLQDEQSQSVDLTAKKKIRFSSCFIELASVLNIELNNIQQDDCSLNTQQPLSLDCDYTS